MVNYAIYDEQKHEFVIILARSYRHALRIFSFAKKGGAK